MFQARFKLFTTHQSPAPAESCVTSWWYTDCVPPPLDSRVASVGPLASVIGVLGLLAASAVIAWRFGPTLLRITGWCSCWAAWASGSQGGYGYGVAFFVLGTGAWSVGTVWYAKRRGRWPSAISERLLTRVFGRRRPLVPVQLQTDSDVAPLRRP